jgi:hypothetical protein
MYSQIICKIIINFTKENEILPKTNEIPGNK